MKLFQHLKVSALAAALLLAAGAVSAQQGLDKVIAIADEDVIMASELQREVQLSAVQARAQGAQLPPEDVFVKQVLERLIVESLQLQIAERAKLVIGDEQVDQAMLNIAQQNNMDLDTFTRRLQQDGLPLATFRENLRRQITIQQVQQNMLGRRIDVTEQDVENFLNSEEGRIFASRVDVSQPIEQIKARHILIKTTVVRDDQAAIELLNKLRKAVIDGGDFGALAKRYSEDLGSALKGGDLGWTSPGQTVPEFEQTMVRTGINEVSEPFQSQFGWHILQVIDKRSQVMRDELLKQQATMVLRQREYQDELPRWLKELRDESYVQIKL